MARPSETDNSRPRPHWLQVITIGRDPRKTFIRGVIIGAFCYALFRFVLLPVRVDGISMEPTYNDRSVNLVNRLSYLWHEPRRGDIVAVRAWAGVHLMLMKRIIGLPGETVAFDHGRVLINGQPLDEPYEKWQSSWTVPPEKLGTNQYLIVGDNRTMPPQDHTWGRVDRDRIVGKVLL
jgi:signal peptidase I